MPELNGLLTQQCKKKLMLIFDYLKILRFSLIRNLNFMAPMIYFAFEIVKLMQLHMTVKQQS